MKLNPKSWLAFVAVIAIAVLGWNVATGGSQEKSEPASSSTAAEEQIKTVRASITINPNIESEVLGAENIEIEEGKTALDLTRKVVGVETSGEGEMAFVTTINGIYADPSKNEFWELVINGQPAQVGAGSYKVKQGDEIEWRISKY